MTNKSLVVLTLIFFCSCNSKPSNKDIEKKILLEYVCPETAKVYSLQIVSTKDAEAISGFKGYEYLVNGDVEWASGCNEFGTGIPPGYTEHFENKRVFLIKTDEGWQ